MGPSFPPLAEALDLGPSGYSPWLVESAVRLGAERPFGPAARLLRHFTGVAMSASTVRRLTTGAGTTLRQHERAAVAALPVGGGEAATVPLQVSMDGSLVAVADEGWREVKLVAIGERRDTETLTALSYAATLGSAETLGDEVVGELVRRGVPGAVEVVAVNDGAVWIQGVLDLHCPQAGRVLDFWHAAEYLSTAAQAAFGPGTAEATTWFTDQRHELRHGDPDQVLAALTALPPSADRDSAFGYLRARREQITYRDFVAKGWPIGSGCVESAHKGIVQHRLKGRGMRWSRPVAEGLLALRVAEANDRWAEAWSPVAATQRAAQRTRTATRRQARRARPPKPKQVVHGKPTPDHCWRRFRLPGSRPLSTPSTKM